MAFKPRSVANVFIDVAADHDRQLSPMKIQKLVYFAHGWHLAILERPLINEGIEAWEFGPVIPSLYRAFRQYRNGPITSKVRAMGQRSNGDFFVFTPTVPADTENGANARSLLQRIWDIYGEYSGAQLSNMTHAEGTPWDRICTAHSGSIPRGTVIPNSLIKSYFESLIEKPDEQR